MNCTQLCNLIEKELIKKYGTLYKAHKVLNVPESRVYHLRNKPSYSLAFSLAQDAGIALSVEVI